MCVCEKVRDREIGYLINKNNKKLQKCLLECFKREGKDDLRLSVQLQARSRGSRAAISLNT